MPHSFPSRRSSDLRAAFSMLLFEDLALVPIIFALGALAPTATDTGWEGIAGVAIRGAITVVAMFVGGRFVLPRLFAQAARTKSPELRSEEHTSELQSLMRISYAVFCLKKKKKDVVHDEQTYNHSYIPK